MKRSPELRDLSVDHHNGLIVARHLRRAAAGEIPLPAAVQELRQAWQTEIGPHFEAEEAVLLPAYASVVGEEAPLIARTLAEHAALRRQVSELAQAVEEEQRRLAGEAGIALEAHIRFEERLLFPAIERALAGPSLASLGEALSHARRRAGGCTMPDRARNAEPPEVVKEFAAAYPEVWEAYNRLGAAATAAGPLDERTQRLAKLALAIGAQRQGAVNSHTRRALAAGCTLEELIHVGILAISTIGWPAAFAAICWINETIQKEANAETSTG
jgi:alkylhydroperoxidase/carboxymuconolactone decarboxylase family protein YurZ